MEGKEESGHACRYRACQKERGHPLSRRPVSSPIITTNPEPIPIKLIMTCTRVNVSMMLVLRMTSMNPALTFGCYFRLTTRTLYWDRGRPARLNVRYALA